MEEVKTRAGFEFDDTGNRTQERTRIIARFRFYFLPDFFMPLPPRGTKRQDTKKVAVQENIQSDNRSSKLLNPILNFVNFKELFMVFLTRRQIINETRGCVISYEPWSSSAAVADG